MVAGPLTTSLFDIDINDYYRYVYEFMSVLYQDNLIEFIVNLKLYYFLFEIHIYF